MTNMNFPNNCYANYPMNQGYCLQTNSCNMHISGGAEDNFFFVNSNGYNSTGTINGGGGHDTVMLNGSMNNYSQSMLYQNGQFYSSFRDQNNNMTLIGNDVENIMFAQSQSDPLLVQLQNWFNTLLNGHTAPANIQPFGPAMAQAQTPYGCQSPGGFQAQQPAM